MRLFYFMFPLAVLANSPNKPTKFIATDQSIGLFSSNRPLRDIWGYPGNAFRRRLQTMNQGGKLRVIHGDASI